MTQTTLWLLPLVLGSIFGIVNALKAGIKWSWGIVIQHSVVLIISVTGLYIYPKWDWLCAYLGWGYLLSFTVIARVFLMKMTQALGLLRCDEAIKNARILKYFLLGPPGRFWLDLAFMTNLAARGDGSAADAIYKKWEAWGLPKSVSDSLAAYTMIGMLIMRDWNGVIEKYENVRRRYLDEVAEKKKEARFSYQIAIPAIRAFNELGRHKEAEEALSLADLPGSSYPRESLETIFLSYFALLGDEEGLNQVLNSMSSSKSALPEHARLFWRGRCASQRRDYEAAIRVYAESLAKTPDKDATWRERTQHQLKLNQERLQSSAHGSINPDALSFEPESHSRSIENEDGSTLCPQPNVRDAHGETPSMLTGGSPASKSEHTESARLQAAKTGRQIMKKCMAIADIMTSRKPPAAVRVLTGIISIAYLCSSVPTIFNDAKLQRIFESGVLDGSAIKGEWWRLVSYMFLHGGLSHLFMNLFGLVWFGRFAENVFGAKRFLIIFFGSGILSGLTQILIDPEGKAVGASGAVLGIFGAGMAAMIRLKDVLPKQIRRHELSWMIALAVTQLLFDQIVNFLFPARPEAQDAVRIAAAAHFGGMVSGFILGWVLPLRKFAADDQ